MNRIAFIAAAAMLCTSAAPALAGEATASGQPEAQGQRAVSQRFVTTCDRDPLTQAAFRTQHGSRPVFVTADQVVNAAGERWTAPRCMSVREQQRLARMMNPR